MRSVERAWRVLPSMEEPGMPANASTTGSFEISPRFRLTVESRIARLERDAASDEVFLESLSDADHIRRHRRLIAAQIGEALRMRLFLDRSRTRVPRGGTEFRTEGRDV